jgi:hypothetical protein
MSVFVFLMFFGGNRSWIFGFVAKEVVVVLSKLCPLKMA